MNIGQTGMHIAEATDPAAHRTNARRVQGRHCSL